MRESVEYSFAQSKIGKHVGPLAEWEIGGQDERPSFLPVTEDLKQQLGVSPREGQVAQLIEHEDVNAAVASNDPVEFGVIAGLDELVGGAAQAAIASYARSVADVVRHL